MSKNKEDGKRETLSSVLDIGTRRITITILSPDVGENHLVNPYGDGIIIDVPKKVTKPVEVSGVLVPSTFRVEGFLDNGIPSSFILTLDVNKESKGNTSRSVRVSRIEADGESGHLSSGLFRDIALDSVRDECLRMAAIRIWLFPAGEWDMNTHEKKTEPSPFSVSVDPQDAPYPHFMTMVHGARAKNAREWALTTSGKKPRAWDSDEVLKAVAILFAECPTIKDRATWIASKLKDEGFVSTRGTPYTKDTINTQIKLARAAGLIEPAKRKKATK
jgi:hypothetical protein